MTTQGRLRHDIGPVIAAVERDLLARSDVQQTLDRIVELAVGHVEAKRTDGQGYASVSLVVARRRVTTVASSDSRATCADTLQREVGEGPCLDAMWIQGSIRIDDLTTERRYPRWTEQTLAQTGIRSSLSLRLFTARESLGALNLYSSTSHTFSEQDVAEGAVFAAQAAVALRSAQTEEQLRAALESRTVIGQAQGILMERYQVGAEQAFDVLRRVSQDRNVRLAVVAARLVEDRHTPGA